MRPAASQGGSEKEKTKRSPRRGMATSCSTLPAEAARGLETTRLKSAMLRERPIPNIRTNMLRGAIQS